MYNTHKNLLLDALCSVKPNFVYNLANLSYLQRGVDYHQYGHLQTIKWKDQNTLECIVLGREAYTVSITLSKDQFLFECNCLAWHRQDNCKHVICSVFGIMHLIHPELFKPKY